MYETDLNPSQPIRTMSLTIWEDTREDTNAEWQPLLCARLSTSFQLRLGVVMETDLFQGVSAASLLMQMLCQDKIKRLLNSSFVC